MIEALGGAGHKAADDHRKPLGHGICQQLLMQVADRRHGLEPWGKAAFAEIERVVFVGDAELGIGADQRFIEHLLLFIVHVRDQQGEEDHQLLDLAGQHRVQLTVIQLVDELHLRGDGLPDLHDVDAVRGAGRDSDKLAAHLTAGTAKLMALDRRHNKALYPTHPHS